MLLSAVPRALCVALVVAAGALYLSCAVAFQPLAQLCFDPSKVATIVVVSWLVYELVTTDALRPRRPAPVPGAWGIEPTRDARALATYARPSRAQRVAARAAVVQALERYGVGACGPRGFFGSFDVHGELERALAAAHSVDTCALYACPWLAVTSIIGALPRGTRLLACAAGADACADLCGAVEAGAALCGARRGACASAQVLDQELKHAAAVDGSQLAVVVCYSGGCERDEGSDSAHVGAGDDEILSLACARRAGATFTLIVVCESDALLPPAASARVDVRVGALSSVLGGGYASGAAALVERQRIGGVGYCFSASLPPAAAAAASALLAAQG